MTDMINKPPHYNQGKIEVADFIIDQKLNFLEGNVIKYLCRHKMKNGLEDLHKARWYLEKLIQTSYDMKVEHPGRPMTLPPLPIPKPPIFKEQETK